MAIELEMMRMRQAIKSFGYSHVKTRQVRIFVVWEGDQRVLIAKKLARAGYWELNEATKELWERYGATGYTLHPHLTTQELIKWFYDEALQLVKKCGHPKKRPHWGRKKGTPNKPKIKMVEEKPTPRRKS